MLEITNKDFNTNNNLYIECSDVLSFEERVFRRGKRRVAMQKRKTHAVS